MTNAYYKDITEAIYKGYGSDTGVLFGIPAQHRQAVETIIKLATDKAFEIAGLP